MARCAVAGDGEIVSALYLIEILFVDRSGGMTFWIPLEAYGPDAGTMKFISGSHRAGGRFVVASGLGCRR